MKYEPFFSTIAELNKAGSGHIPLEQQSSQHLIYSSPATLAFNSPGAEGFGVKRAALSIPGSVMLLIAPGCCGRNTKLLSEVRGYEDRFFFLLLEESDIVNGSHLGKISQAVREILGYLNTRPSCVVLCSTCVDALLGTDWDRVCRKTQKECGIPVRPACMYALTREGRKPPMVLVREMIYSLLEPQKRSARTVNLLGYFAPLHEDCELYELLSELGIRKVREVSRCDTFEEYQKMSRANFNLVLNPEARSAAAALEKRLQIPYIELPRLYQPDKIRSQYQLLASVLGNELTVDPFYEKTGQIIRQFVQKYGTVTTAVGEMLNADSFELALMLVRSGLHVSAIYSEIAEDDFHYIRRLAELSPETKVFSNLSPTMLYYDCGGKDVDLTIGKDARYYHPDVVNVPWNEDRQPYGFAGVQRLFAQMDEALAASK